MHGLSHISWPCSINSKRNGAVYVTMPVGGSTQAIELASIEVAAQTPGQSFHIATNVCVHNFVKHLRVQADAQRAKEIAEEAKETVVDVAAHTKEVIEAKVRIAVSLLTSQPEPVSWALGPHFHACFPPNSDCTCTRVDAAVKPGRCK